MTTVFLTLIFTIFLYDGKYSVMEKQWTQKKNYRNKLNMQIYCIESHKFINRLIETKKKSCLSSLSSSIFQTITAHTIINSY